MPRKCCAFAFALSLLLTGILEAGVGHGGAIASPNIGQEGTLDVLVGGGSPLILSLDVASNAWRTVGAAPAPIGPGGALSSLFNGCDYGLAGGGSTVFFSAAGVFCGIAQLADTPGPVSEGGAIAIAPGSGGAPEDQVYALRGGGTPDFWRYSIAQNVWAVMPGAPATVGDGAALVGFYSNGTLCNTSAFSIAALRGAGSTDFWCFNIDQQRWEVGPPAPAPVGPGGALAQLQRLGNIYALRGGGTQDFWRLGQSGAWLPLASTPGPVGAGGGLVAVNYGTLSQRDSLYALQGGDSTAVWRYDVETNAWTLVSGSTIKNIDCGVQLSRSAYTTGDVVVLSTVHVVNRLDHPLPIELKLWLGGPGSSPVSLANLGADGSIKLSPGFDHTSGPFTLFQVAPGQPRGAYEVGCRLLDPVSGRLLSEEIDPFAIQ